MKFVYSLLFLLIAISPKQTFASDCFAFDTFIAFCENNECIDGFKHVNDKKNIYCGESVTSKIIPASKEDLNKVEEVRNATKLLSSGVYEYKNLGMYKFERNIKKTRFNTIEEAKHYWENERALVLRRQSIINTTINTCINIIAGLILFILIRKRKNLQTKEVITLLLILCALIAYVSSAAELIPIYMFVTRSVSLLLLCSVADILYKNFSAAESKKKLAYRYLMNILFVILLAIGLFVIRMFTGFPP